MRRRREDERDMISVCEIINEYIFLKEESYVFHITELYSLCWIMIHCAEILVIKLDLPNPLNDELKMEMW